MCGRTDGCGWNWTEVNGWTPVDDICSATQVLRRNCTARGNILSKHGRLWTTWLVLAKLGRRRNAGDGLYAPRCGTSDTYRPCLHKPLRAQRVIFSRAPGRNGQTSATAPGRGVWSYKCAGRVLRGPKCVRLRRRQRGCSISAAPMAQVHPAKGGMQSAHQTGNIRNGTGASLHPRGVGFGRAIWDAGGVDAPEKAGFQAESTMVFFCRFVARTPWQHACHTL